MTHDPADDDHLVLTTHRLQLRPWRAGEGPVLRQLWHERDPRVPPHRRPDTNGHPTTDELEQWIHDQRPGRPRLLAVEHTATGEVVGYCGLITNERLPAGEPEIAFELLRCVWGLDLATEAATAVVQWARTCGHTLLWATVREWNTASRRVLAKVGFVETGQVEPDQTYGDTLYLTYYS